VTKTELAQSVPLPLFVVPNNFQVYAVEDGHPRPAVMVVFAGAKDPDDPDQIAAMGHAIEEIRHSPAACLDWRASKN
jgi:hypothetical protein